MQVNMHEAKSQLSKLIAAAIAGEEVLLARNGEPVAKIVAYTPPKLKPPGAWAGLGLPAWNDIDQAALDKEIEELFYGSD
jgi:prevent-host-death family protein